MKLNVKVVDGWLAGVNSRVVNTAMSHAAPLLMKQWLEWLKRLQAAGAAMWKALRATQAPVWVTMPVDGASPASVVSLRLCVVFNSRRVVSLLKESNCRSISLAHSPD